MLRPSYSQEGGAQVPRVIPGGVIACSGRDEAGASAYIEQLLAPGPAGYAPDTLE